MERAGLWYHITARGNERKDIFRDDRDRRHFLELLEELTVVFSVRLHAFVLMSNHYHLLLELTEPNLSRALHWLNVSYPVGFNRRHQRSGHLLQGRFKSVVVDPQAWALEVSRYIHLNPVRLKRHGLGKRDVQRSRAVGVEALSAGEVRGRIGILRPYRWSSLRAYVGTQRVPAWLCTEEVLRFGGMVRNASERYREYVEGALRQGMSESPWDKVIGQTVLGTERFVASLMRGKARQDERRRLDARPSFPDIVRAVEAAGAGKWAGFRDCYGDNRRDLVLYLARREGGLSYRQLCEQTDIAYSSAAAAVRRFTQRLTHEKELQRLVQQTMDQMHNA